MAEEHTLPLSLSLYVCICVCLYLFLSPERTRSFGVRRAKTKERTSPERVRSPRGSTVGASLSQSHQTTVIATGATSHRALDAEANTITPSFGSFSFSPLPPTCRPPSPRLVPSPSTFLVSPSSLALLSRSVPLQPMPDSTMSPSRDSVLRHGALNYSPRMLPGNN